MAIVKLPRPKRFVVATKLHKLIMIAAARVSTPIANEAEANRIGLLLRAVKDVRRACAAHYKAIKDPLNKARAEVLAMEKQQIEPLDRLESLLGEMIARWLRECETARQQQLAKEQAAAIESAQTERAQQVGNLHRVADAEQDASVAAAMRAEATSLAHAPIVVERVATPPVAKPAGISVKKLYTASVTDFRALVQAVARGEVALEALLPNETWLNQWARANEGGATLPGVTVLIAPSITGRSLTEAEQPV